MNLVELLTHPEGKTLEFKRDLSSPDGVLRSLIAFANTAGGILLVGEEDGTRQVRGVKDVLLEEEMDVENDEEDDKEFILAPNSQPVVEGSDLEGADEEGEGQAGGDSGNESSSESSSDELVIVLPKGVPEI